MSPGQGEEAEGQGQPGPLEGGDPRVSSEAPPVGPPPNPKAPGASPEAPPDDEQVKAGSSDDESVELPPHLNLWVHNCGTVTAGAPPAKCPGCQRLSPEGEWFLYKVALV